MTLWDLQQSASATVSGFAQDLNEKYRLRLAELGFGVGESVTCLKKIPFNGPRVYKIGGSVFSIDRDVASQVMIATGEQRR